MFLRVAILSVLFVSLYASSCGALSGSNSACGSHMMITVDGSSYLGDQNKATQLLNFISNTLMPKWAAPSTRKTQFSYSLYGLVNRTGLVCQGYNTKGVSDPDEVCTALSQVSTSTGRGTTAPITLFDITADIFNCTINYETQVYDLVILFTANNNLGDISNSAWFAADYPTIVVNLGKGDYSSWTAKSSKTTVLCAGNTFDDNLANKIIAAQCGRGNGSEQCNIDPPTTQPPRTVGPTVPDDQASLCDCNIKQSWNDIMILADASTAMGLDRFHELQDFVQSALVDATLGNQAYQTQVGVITYSGTAKMIAELDKYKSIDDFFADDWGTIGNESTNILAAVDMAMDHFETSKHRKNSRKVMIIGASTYREGGYEFPTNQTYTFKANFGVIIVLGYGDIRGVGTEVLQNIATPGMYIDARPGTLPSFKDLTSLVCDANCFCPGQQIDGYFPITRANESWPSQGCYWDSALPSIQPLVPRTCSQLVHGAGVMAMPDTLVKQQGLFAGAPQNLTQPAFFIGLQRQPNGTWQWNDGRPYTGADLIGAGDCATLKRGSGFNLQINAVDCHDGFYYSCETKPCTSTYYCEGAPA